MDDQCNCRLERVQTSDTLEDLVAVREPYELDDAGIDTASDDSQHQRYVRQLHLEHVYKVVLFSQLDTVLFVVAGFLYQILENIPRKSRNQYPTEQELSQRNIIQHFLLVVYEILQDEILALHVVVVLSLEMGARNPVFEHVLQRGYHLPSSVVD